MIQFRKPGPALEGACCMVMMRRLWAGDLVLGFVGSACVGPANARLRFLLPTCPACGYRFADWHQPLAAYSVDLVPQGRIPEAASYAALSKKRTP